MSHPGGHRPRPHSTAPGTRTRGGVRPVLAGLLDSVLESLAPVPIGATDSIDAWVRATYEDGRSRTDSVRIPVAAAEYEHERLTVAPRFGSPLNEEDQARLSRDREKAARVARAAHATPRICGPTVILPRDDRITSGFGTGREFNGRISSRHMGLDLVQAGDTVSAGTPVGRVGATGRVTGPHLHWVVRYGTTSVDPRSLLELP